MKKAIFVILILFFVFPVISAETIANAAINIRIYNNTLELNNSFYSGNYQIFTFNITNNSVVLREILYNFFLIQNSSVSSDIVGQLTACLTAKSACELDKNSFNTAWNTCRTQLAQYDPTGNNSLQVQLTQCIVEKGSKDLSIQENAQKMTTLQEKLTAAERKSTTFGIGGLVIGALAFWLIGKFRKGEIGPGRAKDDKEGFLKDRAG